MNVPPPRHATDGIEPLNRDDVPEFVEPAGWRVVLRDSGGWPKMVLEHRQLCVIASVERYQDKGRWLHISVSSLRRYTPTWSEMEHVKRAFCGDRWAMQVHPPSSKYVNIHPGVLHIWCPLDPFPVPDFAPTGSI